MGLLTFKGGIHPFDGKELSKEQPIEVYLPKGTMAYPLSQHIGAPAKPVVKKGDRVLKGQVIAEAGGFVSAPIHASVSGTVKGMEPRLTATGTMANAIIVENDQQYEEVEYQPVTSLGELTKEEILKRIQVKLAPKNPESIEYILVNGAECEPYLTSDYRRLLEEGEQVVEGLKVMLALFDNAKGYICIEDNKPDCIRKMEELVKDIPRIEVKALMTKYPQGGERALIYATTGREINSSMLPADVGCVVDNVDTVTAIYKAVMLGRPVIDRIVTVTGDAVAQPKNFLVSTGTNMNELVEAAGGFKGQPEKIISGGPMMGFSMYGLDIPCTKTSSAILSFLRDEVSHVQETACINCGRCVSVCPGHVIPARLATFAQHGDMEKFQEFDGMECCECGCCSYICPAKRPLTQSIKSMRKMVLASRKRG